jgi:GNAT superfamily N-acetyltransferase
MAIRFEVRIFDKDVRDAYERLLPEQSDLVASGKLDWKFDHSPGGRGVVAVAVEDAEPQLIMGMIGYAPAALKVGHSRLLAFQAMDTIVHPDLRGRGLFTNLGNTFYAESPRLGAKILYGFPNDNAAPGWFNKLQWARLGTPPFLIKPLRMEYFAKRIDKNLGRFFRLPLTLLSRGAASDDIVRVDAFDSRVDELWTTFSRDIGCAVDRNHKFLNWRLFEHPTEKYITHAIFRPEGSLAGFVSTVTADKHGGRVGYIMEAMAMPDARNDLHRLLSNAVTEMYQDGADVVLAWAAPWAPNYRAYRRAGFLPLPETLRPIHLYFGGRSLDSELSPVMTSQDSWYLSYLDSDTV